MIKKLKWIYFAFVLAGCTTHAIQPVPSGSLPSVGQLTSPLPSVPTQAEWVKAQPLSERKALWGYIKTHHTPVIETSESIQFPFGRMTPAISCSPLHTCDLALQPGEKVTGVYPGDTARWLFAEAVSGDEQMHVIFKPKEADIATNAIITTTKRTYHLDLISKNNARSKPVLFYYPDDFTQSWFNLQNAAKALRNEEHTQQAEEAQAFHQLDFNYRLIFPLVGDKPLWTPERVFNNGTQVYIQMPPAAEHMALPALFMIGNDGEPALVNVRVRKPYYIVDGLFQKAMLVSGVGKNQQRITIIYQGQ